MCQNVRNRCGRSSERGARQTGIGLRVSGATGSPALPQLGTVAADDCLAAGPLGSRRDLEARRRPRRRRGGRGGGEQDAEQKEAVLEDSREIGQPRRSAGGMPVEHGFPAARWLEPGSALGDRRIEAVRVEETRPSKGVQSRPSGRRSRTLGHRAQPRRVQDGFHSTAGAQGRLEATHRWEGALLPRSLATSVQIRIDIHDKT